MKSSGRVNDARCNRDDYDVITQSPKLV